MSPDPSELLRHHGLQVTTHRVAILESVAADPHCTADAVAAAANRRLGSISQKAVAAPDQRSGLAPCHGRGNTW